MFLFPQQTEQLISQHDYSTLGHVIRVSHIMEKFACYLGFNTEENNLAVVGSLLHDIGKLQLDPTILHKQGKLTPEEFIHIQQHPLFGYHRLKELQLEPAIFNMARWHHERWDGTGYPDRLSGDQIPFLCCMLSIVDAWEAMTGKRTYRRPLTDKEAIMNLTNGKGSQFHPDLVDTFIQMLEESQNKKEFGGILHAG